MALNVEKNKQPLLKAWRDVVDDKNAIDWALFGYEGHTFDLKVVDCGDGGLEEIVNEFNSGQIMYAFCRVIDPKTSLPKFVLINWQGECAPGDRKGKCATHLRDVANFFKGAHLTLNARTEDDVDPSMIIDKVAKSTGSSYSFTDRDGPLQNTLPVGSVYRRTIPAAEINPVERDKFWEKTEAEEKVRLEDDRKKSEEVKQRLEEERKRRELAEAQQREEISKQRSRSISQLRVAEAGASRKQSESVNGKRWEQKLSQDSHDDEERKMRSESLRKERKQEVESLISQRTINARAVFEQNTIYGNTYSGTAEVVERNGSHSPKHTELQSPSRSSATSLPYLASLSSATEGHPAHTNVQKNEEEHNELAVKSGPNVPPQHIDNYHEAGAAHIMNTAVPIEIAEDRVVSSDYHQDVFVPGQGLKARSIYDYQAADDTEISFNPDDIITNIDQIDEGWWQGLAPDGTYGLFPANYVELMDN